MTRLRVLIVGTGLVLLASGCLGSSATPTTKTGAARAVSPGLPRPFALLKVTGSYTTSGGQNHFTGEIHHERFTLKCFAPRFYRQLAGVFDWRAKLCLAILDYQAAPQRVTACFCPVSIANIAVEGTIQSHAVRYGFTPCTCGLGKRAAHDVHIILTTHPRPVS
jgi:hypothetical protein